MTAEHQRVAARFSQWALDHPWGYAILFTTSFFTTWFLASIAFGSSPVLDTVEDAIIGYLPTLALMRWIIGRPSVRKQWERRAAERQETAEA